GEVARADDPDPGTGKAALGELLGEDAGLRAGKVDEGGIGVDVADTLQERRKVRIGQGDADRFDDLAAELGEALLERGLRFGARPSLAATSPMIQDDGARMKLVRRKKGDAVVVTEAPEIMTPVAIFAWVTSGP